MNQMVTPKADTLRGPLVDRFGRAHTYLRISVTDRCNFRCAYCMPKEGVVWREHDEILRHEETVRIARVFVEMGVNKIRLTGGEPTVRKGLVSLAEALAELPGSPELAMTTNGYSMDRLAQPLREAGVRSVNVSLDTLRADRFREITHTDKFDDVLRGLDACLEAGFPSIKLNMVVMAGVNEDEILDFVALARDRPLQVRFIEFMPFTGNRWSRAGLYPYAAMRKQIKERYEIELLETDPSAVGKEFSLPGFVGSIAFVTSMTDSFCSGCSRIRLLADGQVKPCLFLPAEVGLRQPLRNGCDDNEIERLIRLALDRKWKEHPPMEDLKRLDNRRMIEIGG
jgi:cyclic pyranopterin phosphate synthase